jgi:hypothetical protein
MNATVLPRLLIGLLLFPVSLIGTLSASDTKTLSSNALDALIVRDYEKEKSPVKNKATTALATPTPKATAKEAIAGKTATAAPSSQGTVKEADKPASPPKKTAKFALAEIGPLEKLPPFNRSLCQHLSKMPDGGGYAATTHAMEQLKKSVSLNEKGELTTEVSHAQPSFCSSATYLAFLSVLSDPEIARKTHLTKERSQKLLIRGQPDGVGVWGRWNANGPGTAMLVKELGIGQNFLDLKKALPGDFLKIWWTKEIGAKEHGHSVVYLRTCTNAAGDPMLRFWSSNVPGGYGVREVPMTSVKNMLFSRITKPEEIQRVADLKATNAFLYSMTSKSVTMDDVKKELGMKNGDPEKSSVVEKPHPGEPKGKSPTE